MVIMIRSLVSTVLLTLVSWPRDVHSVPSPTLGIFSQCVGTIEECLERAQGMYPLCTDCAQFVVCSAQSSTIMNCTPSTLYDASLGVCNFPGLAVCGTNNTTTTTTAATVTTPDTAAQIVSEQTVFGDCVDGVEQCEDAGRRSGQYPHCSDCAKFIKCNGAVKVSAVITCQGSLQYDVNLGVCTFFSGAVCGTNTNTATTPDTAAQIVPEQTVFGDCVDGVEQCEDAGRRSGQYPHCSDCAKFIKCNGAVNASAVLTCQGGMQYDVNLGVCTIFSEAVCGTNTNNTVTTPDTAAQIVPEQTVFGDCVDGVEQCEDAGRRSGHYPHCLDCAKFIKCNDAVNASTVVTCQVGLQYDVNLGVCTIFSEAVCGTNTNNTATTPDTAAQIVPEQTVFGDCVDGLEQCEDAGRRSGQYPHCSDCAKFIKCNGAVNASAVVTCQGVMQYDVNLGVCTFFLQAVCGTNTDEMK